MTEPSKIVPFGKYKGQPIEALAQDKPYLDWLSGRRTDAEMVCASHQLPVYI